MNEVASFTDFRARIANIDMDALPVDSDYHQMRIPNPRPGFEIESPTLFSGTAHREFGNFYAMKMVEYFPENDGVRRSNRPLTTVPPQHARKVLNVCSSVKHYSIDLNRFEKV